MHFEEEVVTFSDIMKMVGLVLCVSMPQIERFDGQISKFRQMKTQLSTPKTPIDLHWVCINVQPVKIQILQFVGMRASKSSAILLDFATECIAPLDSFIDTVTDFRTEILRNCNFSELNAVSGEYDLTYAGIDECHLKTIEVMKAAKEYNNLELLFDMLMSNYRALKESIDDLILLKNLWDAIVLVKETFLDW